LFDSPFLFLCFHWPLSVADANPLSVNQVRLSAAHCNTVMSSSFASFNISAELLALPFTLHSSHLSTLCLSSVFPRSIYSQIHIICLTSFGFGSSPLSTSSFGSPIVVDGQPTVDWALFPLTSSSTLRAKCSQRFQHNTRAVCSCWSESYARVRKEQPTSSLSPSPLLFILVVDHRRSSSPRSSLVRVLFSSSGDWIVSSILFDCTINLTHTD
jgi:hypothetical protein